MRRAAPLSVVLAIAVAFAATAAAQLPGVTASVKRVSGTHQRVTITNRGSTTVSRFIFKIQDTTITSAALTSVRKTAGIAAVKCKKWIDPYTDAKGKKHTTGTPSAT